MDVWLEWVAAPSMLEFAACREGEGNSMGFRTRSGRRGCSVRVCREAHALHTLTQPRSGCPRKTCVASTSIVLSVLYQPRSRTSARASHKAGRGIWEFPSLALGHGDALVPEMGLLDSGH